MPYKDREKRLAYQRAWYARNRSKVIAKITHRRQTMYAGKCINCGGPTVGQSKNDRPEWCGKPECRSAQRKKS